MISLVNVREHRRGNQNWTIQRNWKHWAYKTKKNKAQMFVGGLMSYLHYLCLFGSSLPLVVCRRTHVLFMLLTTRGKDKPNTRIVKKTSPNLVETVTAAII
jgi:hypothetical protein